MADIMAGSAAFHRLMEFNYGDEERAKLMRDVWSVTPWIVHVRTGAVNGDLSFEIMNWCRDNLGREASPIHGRQGAWQRSCVTIDGWTDYGFATGIIYLTPR